MFRIRPIFEPSPSYPSCHAATVVDLPGGKLLAAWFAGTHEGYMDVSIWMARFDGDRWTHLHPVAKEPGVPLWNPVLFCDATGTVWLFYKVGPTIPSWTGAYMISRDDGETWSVPTALPAGLLGPAKNKPLLLANGDILCGTSTETFRSWSCWVEVSGDGGDTWSKYGPIVAPGLGHQGPGASEIEPASAAASAAAGKLALPERHRGLIQPAVWEFAPGRLMMLMRATQAVGFVCSAGSDDYGRTWSNSELTTIPCPNSGLDAVKLADGRIVLACNPVPEGRTPLSLLVSEDNGGSWSLCIDVETARGEYSYPSIIQSADGLVHVVYTYRRIQIRHLVLHPDDLRPV
jgi:predicted neuraminidase